MASPQYLPLDETHPTSATNPYGRSKLQIEEILADVPAPSDPALRVLCLRYFNPVGAHPSGFIGDNPRACPTTSCPMWPRWLRASCRCLGVFGNDYDTPDGTGVRDYIHVMDLAERPPGGAGFLQHQAGWHAINLGTGQGYSVLEMVRAFEPPVAKPVPYDVKPRRAGDIGHLLRQPGQGQGTVGMGGHAGPAGDVRQHVAVAEQGGFESVALTAGARGRNRTGTPCGGGF
jgi:UDP-glucose 4-epimerase